MQAVFRCKYLLKGLPMDDRQKMERARILIKNGDYQKARDLLSSVNHDKASAWIKRLDTEYGTKKHHSTRRWVFVVVAIAIFVLVAGTLNAIRQQGVYYRQATHEDFTTQYACLDIVYELLIANIDYTTLPDKAADELRGMVMSDCGTWLDLVDDSVQTYCVQEFDAEIADHSIKQEHLIDCILEREDETMTTLLVLYAQNAVGFANQQSE